MCDSNKMYLGHAEQMCLISVAAREIIVSLKMYHRITAL